MLLAGEEETRSDASDDEGDDKDVAFQAWMKVEKKGDIRVP